MIAVYSNIRSKTKNASVLPQYIKEHSINMSKSQSCISNSRAWFYQRQGHGFDYVYLECKVALDKASEIINNMVLLWYLLLGYCITVTRYRCHVLIFVNLPSTEPTYTKNCTVISLCAVIEAAKVLVPCFSSKAQ